MSATGYQRNREREIRAGGLAGGSGRQFLLRVGAVRRRAVATPSRRRSTTAVKPGRYRKRRCWRRLAAAIRPRWRDSSPGETVLDLGSGGGIDVLLSARRVGPPGKAYGLDMTDEMLALARENQKKAGIENAEFLKGEIENIPLPDNSVDVIISNCVVNLSGDKDRVMRESFRVLKPGGRFAVSDVVVAGEVPDEVRKSVELWIGCIAGALRNDEYASKLAQAGFEDIAVEPTRVYNAEDARQFLAGQGFDVDALAPQVEGKFMSAFIRALKPQACCGPSCCEGSK